MRSRYRYGCFEPFGEDTQAYGYAASIGLSKSCEDAGVSQLLELQRRAAAYAGRKRVQPALPNSYEALFHERHLGRFLVILRDGDVAITLLRRPRLERAIGVIYRPETERLSHFLGPPARAV